MGRDPGTLLEDRGKKNRRRKFWAKKLREYHGPLSRSWILVIPTRDLYKVSKPPADDVPDPL